jgi:hypothetical protein
MAFTFPTLPKLKQSKVWLPAARQTEAYRKPDWAIAVKAVGEFWQRFMAVQTRSIQIALRRFNSSASTTANSAWAPRIQPSSSLKRAG